MLISEQNVLIVRDSFDAFAKRGLDALAKFWHPEINWRAIEGAPDDVGETPGIEAVRRYLQDWLDMFDDITVVPEKLIDVGDDRVIAVQLTSGRAKLSGIETQLRYAVLYTVWDGKIVRGREYAELAEALKAVGLEE